MSTRDLIRLSMEMRLPGHRERRRIRLRAGLTQQQLAEHLGVSRPTVSRWEQGSREPYGALRRDYSRALVALKGRR